MKQKIKHPNIVKVLEPKPYNSKHRWCEAEINGIKFMIRKPFSAIKNLIK